MDSNRQAVETIFTRERFCSYRYGGEEFTIILPITPIKDGTIMAEKMNGINGKGLFPGVGSKSLFNGEYRFC